MWNVTRFVSLVVTAALIAMPAWAADSAAPGSNPRCIPANRIQTTKIVDQNTVLFKMVGGKTWRNTLASPCHTMLTQTGFS